MSTNQLSNNYINTPLDFNGSIQKAAMSIKQHRLHSLISDFLHEQLGRNDTDRMPMHGLGYHVLSLKLFRSAKAEFYAPSDLSGIHGRRVEHIRATPTWNSGSSRYDTVFVNADSNLPGMAGLLIARVFSFLSFKYGGTEYPCALIQWYSCVSDEADEATGMWVVEPDFNDGNPHLAIIHLDAILRAAHLIGRCRGPDAGFLPRTVSAETALDYFDYFYVNKYVDHHAYEIAF